MSDAARRNVESTGSGLICWLAKSGRLAGLSLGLSTGWDVAHSSIALNAALSSPKRRTIADTTVPVPIAPSSSLAAAASAAGPAAIAAMTGAAAAAAPAARYTPCQPERPRRGPLSLSPMRPQPLPAGGSYGVASVRPAQFLDKDDVNGVRMVQNHVSRVRRLER